MMALLRSNAYLIFRSTSRNGANGTEETKKKRPGMQSTGDWDNPEPLRPRSSSKGSRNRANGTEEVKKKRRKSGMQSTGGWDIPDAHPTKKRTVCLTKIFLPCRR